MSGNPGPSGGTAPSSSQGPPPVRVQEAFPVKDEDRERHKRGPFDEPLTPWAERYGFNDDLRRIETGSSGLHPHLPDLPVEPSDPNADVNELLVASSRPLDMPPASEFDNLLAEEAIQRSYLAGLPTWQALALQSPLVNMVDGSGKTKDDQGNVLMQEVVVDELRWHPFFWKSKWHDLRGSKIRDNFPEALWTIPGDADWSVDVPELWDVMRPCIEIANRFLMATAEGPFIDAFLNSRFTWNEAIPRPGVPQPVAAVPRPPEERPDAQQLLSNLANIADLILWSFFDDAIEPVRQDGALQGIALHQYPNHTATRGFVGIRLNTRLFKALLDPRTSFAEQCLSRFNIADIHAIYIANRFLLNWPVYEPYYNYEWVNELGWSWNAHLFGKAMSNYPRGTNFKLLQKSEDFPNMYRATIENKFVDEEYHLANDTLWYEYAVPPYWASRIFTEDFWQVDTRKYGLDALKAPKMFRTWRSAFDHGIAKRARVDHVVRDMRPFLRTARRELEKRRRAWHIYRPWYPCQQTLWQDSPYNRTHCRAQLKRFLRAYRLRDEGIAGRMAASNLRDMRDCQLNVSAFATLPYWEAVHWLMFVALPRRTVPAVSTRKAIHPRVDMLMPSKEADKSGFRYVWSKPMHMPEPVIHIRPRHTLESWSRPRSTILERIARHFKDYEMAFPVPSALHAAFWACYNDMKIKTAISSQDIWLDFDFEVPPYAYNTEVIRGMKPNGAPNDTYEPYVGQIPSPFENYLHEDLHSLAGRTASDWDSVEGQPGVRAAMFQAPASASGGGEPPVKYYTIGEVADHWNVITWVLVQDEQGGFDVFDVTELRKTWDRDYPGFSMDIVCKKTLWGQQAWDESFIRDIKTGLVRVGKLQQWKTKQEIAENDGTDGKPFWISLGRKVFDITDFPPKSPEEHEVLHSVPGGEPQISDGLLGPGGVLTDLDELLDRLEPFKCAFVRDMQPREGLNRVYTEKEVAWYCYRRSHGLYMTIQGLVYNVTDFMDFHPGGSEILAKYGGQDATNAFHENHQNPAACLQGYDYLRVGRLVPEKTMKELGEYEFVVHGLVYNVEPLRTTNPPLYNRLRYYLKQDATSALTDELVNRHALLKLLEMRHLITGKLARTLTQMMPEKLAAHTGEGLPGMPDPLLNQGPPGTGPPVMPLSMCVGDNIYIMTEPYRHGPEELKERLRPFAGKQVTDQELAQYLVTNQSHRILAKLWVERPPAPTKIAKPTGRVGTKTVEEPVAKAKDMVEQAVRAETGQGSGQGPSGRGSGRGSDQASSGRGAGREATRAGGPRPARGRGQERDPRPERSGRGATQGRGEDPFQLAFRPPRGGRGGPGGSTGAKRFRVKDEETGSWDSDESDSDSEPEAAEELTA